MEYLRIIPLGFLVFFAVIGILFTASYIAGYNVIKPIRTKQIIEVIPTYNIVYNYSTNVNATITKLKRPGVLLFYIGDYNKKVAQFVYQFMTKRNVTLYLYDLDKPWFGIQIGNNSTLPLAIPLTPPALICMPKKGKPIIVLGKDRIMDNETLNLLLNRCIYK